jgi:hypothetical protein
MHFFRTFFFHLTIMPLIFSSCSAFKFTYEDTEEVCIPVEKAWNFFTNLDNWPLWTYQTEYFYCEEELQTGSIITAKIKNINTPLYVRVTEVIPYKKLSTEIGILHSEKNSNTFEEIAPGKTRICSKYVAKGLFVPLIKSCLIKELNRQKPIIRALMDELESESQEVDCQAF